MPPSDHTFTKSTPTIIEHYSFGKDEVGVRMLSPNLSISNFPQDKEEIDERISLTNTKTKRTLHFHNAASILLIEKAENMSEKEIDACYYKSRDYSCFRDRERRISRIFSNSSAMNGCRKGDYLGVESQLQRFHRRQRSKNAVFAVMLEQELRQENVDDADSLPGEDDLTIARVYHQYTRESARLARERATANACQVGRTASLLPCTGRESIDEMKKGEEEVRIVSIHFELSCKVPASNKMERRRTAQEI